ncbi:MAG: PEGA domain-containing protein [Bacteroidales bacterium]|jgi:hypothetical protein|nr:PEGA domain-containing protein [Bacteroidales bacterium]
MKQKCITAAVIVASIFSFSSCATMFSNNSYPVTINSNPQGARVSITNQTGREVFVGNTPTTVRLDAGIGYFQKADYTLRFSAPGFQDQIIPISSRISGWYFVNIISPWTLFGILIVDPLTGSMWTIDQDFVNVTLVPTTAQTRAGELHIMNLDEIPDSWKEHLVQVQ